MCGIFASRSVDVFNNLKYINQHRGLDYWSVTTISASRGIVRADSGSGLMPMLFAAEEDDVYYIGHIQAQTSKASGLQPVVDGKTHKSYLLHNGIIKAAGLKEGEWDTQWLMNRLRESHGYQLDGVNGSFACVYFDNYTTAIFRNQTSPLFWDTFLNLSSVEFVDSEPFPIGEVHELNLSMMGKKSECVSKFKNKQSNYFILQQEGNE